MCHPPACPETQRSRSRGGADHSRDTEFPGRRTSRSVVQSDRISGVVSGSCDKRFGLFVEAWCGDSRVRYQAVGMRKVELSIPRAAEKIETHIIQLHHDALYVSVYFLR